MTGDPEASAGAGASAIEHLVVAIDGPAGSGKSTAARRVAGALGITLLDTGAIYRSLALAARRAGVDWADGPALARLALDLPLAFAGRPEESRVLLGGEDISAEIRSQEISAGASQVSALAEVRQALLALQRSFVRAGPLVAEGRDMGTVVFPGAQVKVFLVADAEQRARRRHRELVAMGQRVTLDEVRAGQVARDASDASREVAPLRAADDAVTLDTTSLTIDEVVQRILALVRRRGA